MQRQNLRITFLHLSLNHGCHCDTTDDFTISFLHFSLFFTALLDLANSRPVHSLMWSSHLFFVVVCFVIFPISMCLARWFWPDLMNRSLVKANCRLQKLEQQNI